MFGSHQEGSFLPLRPHLDMVMALGTGTKGAPFSNSQGPTTVGDFSVGDGCRYRADPAPFEWLESFMELESLIKEAVW